MNFPESDRKECADIIGLADKELFDCFYLAIREEDLGKCIEENNDLVEITENSDCYDKILVVWGHPLFAYISVYGAVSINEEYKFFRIEEKDIEGFKVVKFLWPEFEGKKYTLFLHNEIKKSSPELDKRLLRKIFLKSGGGRDGCDNFLLWGLEDVLKEVSLEFFTEKEIMRLYKAAKKEKNCNKLKTLILRKLLNQKVLKNIVINKNENDIVKAAAVINIDDIDFLFYIFEKAQSYLHGKIFKKIVMLSGKKLDINFLVSAVLNRMFPRDTREIAIWEISDIALLEEIVWSLESPVTFAFYDSLETMALSRIYRIAEQKGIDEQGFFIEAALSKDLPRDAREFAERCISNKNVLKK